MRTEAQSLEVVAAVGVGASIDVSRFVGKTVIFAGTFVATVAIEATIDDVNWATIGSNATAPSVQIFDQTVRRIRVRTVAFTSGAPAASFCGFDARSE